MQKFYRDNLVYPSIIFLFEEDLTETVKSILEKNNNDLSELSALDFNLKIEEIRHAFLINFYFNDKTVILKSKHGNRGVF